MGATEVIGSGGAGQLDAMLADLERVRRAGAAEGVESTS